MHDIDLIGVLLFLISSVLLTLAIKSKSSYIMLGAIVYSFIALPLLFVTGV